MSSDYTYKRLGNRIPNVKFNLKGDLNQRTKERATIMLVFRYKNNVRRLRLQYSTGEKIAPKYWDAKKQRAKNIAAYATEFKSINEKLEELERITREIFVETAGRIEMKDFRQLLKERTGRIETNKVTFLSFIGSYIKKRERAAGAKKGTIQPLKTILLHLEQMSKEGIRVDFDDITIDFKDTYANWCYAEPRQHSQNTVSRKFSAIKMMLEAAHLEGHHDNDVFKYRKFSISSVKTKNKTRFDFEELGILAAYDFSDSPRLEQARDLFLVGCYTGLRVSDWYKFSKDAIKEKDGNKYINIRTEKIADMVVSIPLLSKLEAILEKYDFDLEQIRRSDDKVRKDIKKVVKIALPDAMYEKQESKGKEIIRTRIHKYKGVGTHAARRSFATNFLKLGVSVSALMGILGHATEEQFREYIDLDATDNISEFFEVSKKMK